MGFKNRIKKAINFPTIVVFLGTLIGLMYLFSFLFPITDNAFVTANSTPVSATVSGYVTDVHVKNGDFVKKGSKVITIFQEPYKLSLQKATSNYNEANENLSAMKKRLEKDLELLNAQTKLYEKIKLEYELKNRASVANSVSKLEVATLEKQTAEAYANVSALKKQIDIDESDIKALMQKLASLKAVMHTAEVDLNETVVTALSDGYVQNLFIGLRTPVKANEPLFAIIDTNETYIQANFIENDLRNVKIGDEVVIVPRMYLGSKSYKGIVVSDYWSVERQITNQKTQNQIVLRENQWLMLPQRLPVQIKITDLDQNYPLRVGMSAYVYIKTR